jgi:hypothetical protein
MSVGSFTGALDELEVFPSRFRRHRITGSNAVFNAKISRFADVPRDSTRISI